MSKARLVLIALICASPPILLVGGLIVQALVAGLVAAGLAIVARSLRPGETEFLVSLVRPLAVVAAVPALWMLIQVLPLAVFAHPIWTSAREAFGRPLAETMSIDPGASVIALGQYLSMTGVVFLSAAVAVDRQRAEWLLFALTGACAAVALIVLAHDLFLPSLRLTVLARAQAIDCLAMGAILAGAACLRTVERYETRHTNQQRSVLALLWTFAAGAAALIICTATLILEGGYWTIFTLVCGLLALASVWIIRRLALGRWSIGAVAGLGLVVILFLLSAHPIARDRDLAFAAAPSGPLLELGDRVLGDAPLVGTGAGTFADVAPIYREMDDPPPGAVPATTAAALAIELGKPMLLLIAAAAAGCTVVLLRASLLRGRDSFYPAMGGSCLLTMLLLAFVNAGLLGTAASLILAAALGIGVAQSKGRRAQPQTIASVNPSPSPSG